MSQRPQRMSGWVETAMPFSMPLRQAAMSWRRMVMIRVGRGGVGGRDMIALHRAARHLQIEKAVGMRLLAIISRITIFKAARPIGMGMPSSRKERSMRSRWPSSSVGAPF